MQRYGQPKNHEQDENQDNYTRFKFNIEIIEETSPLLQNQSISGLVRFNGVYMQKW